MIPLRPEEITAVIQKEIQDFSTKLRQESIGTVIQVGDGIARVHGLDQAMLGELVTFEDQSTGLVLNLEEDSVGVIIFGADNPDKNIKEGQIVKRTGKIAQVPVGKAMLGRVVDALGNPIDGKGSIVPDRYRPIESKAAGVIDRQPVKDPLQTGIKAIDAMIPIGLGQRELIIGDRQTGKTAIVVDTIMNQKNSGVYCIYVAIGQKISNVVGLAQILEEHGALAYTTIVCASARDSASMQYLAPYAGCAIGEEFMYAGQNALVIYDDLSKHAQAYRQLSLLLRRPPGREAYPGDVFYLHSRLLERAAKLHDNLGAGSLTALPLIETQAGDITSYIPTNVISITDGQIFLDNDLFYSGVRPAINVGLSVSRVGGKAQTKAMRQVAGKLRLDLAQYKELVAFTKFGSELDKATQMQLTRGERMVEILKQGQYDPLSVAREVLIIYAGVNGFLDDLPVSQINRFEIEFNKYIQEKYSAIIHEIETKKELSDDLRLKLNQALAAFKHQFVKTK